MNCHFRRFSLLLLMLFGIAGFATSQATAAGRAALVIGNSAYPFSRLINPANDAQLIAATLGKVGFDVTTVLDADRQTMQKAMIEFSRAIRDTDTVGLFYFAGHGVQSNNQNYLIPIDADIKSDSEVKLFGINVDEFVSTLERASGRVNIVILDSCRNNPFISKSRGGKNGIGAIDAPTGTFIAFSTTPGQVALDGEGANSPYAAALAKAIEMPGLSIEQTFKVARRQVLKETKEVQLPWDTSSLTGDFSFSEELPIVTTPVVIAPEVKVEEPKVEAPPPEVEVALDTPQQGPSVVDEQPEPDPVAQAPDAMEEINPTPKIIPVGKWPEGITLAADGLWVAESGIRQISRINLQAGKIDKTVKSGRLPVQMATDDNGNVFANVVTDGKIFRQSSDGKGKSIMSIPKLTYTADMVSRGGFVYALTQVDNPDRKFTVNIIDGVSGKLTKTQEVVGDPRAVAAVDSQPWVLYKAGDGTELVQFAGESETLSAPLHLQGFGWKMAANQSNLYIGGQEEQQVGEAMITMVNAAEQKIVKIQLLKSQELIVTVAASDTHVVAMSYAGNTWILDANTLQPLKHFNSGVPAQSAIISGGNLYLATHNGKGGNGAVYVYEGILN